MTGFVYAISNGRGEIKIGWTSDLRRRLSELNVGSATKHILLGAVPASHPQQREVHSLLQDWRVRGEWFAHTGPVSAFVSMLGRVSFDKRDKRISIVAPFFDTHFKAAVDVFDGKESRLAKARGVSQNAIWAAGRAGRVSADLAKKIEAATAGKVAKWQLRPDLWDAPAETVAA